MGHLPQENIPESSLLKLSFQIASVLCAVLKLYQLNYQGSPFVGVYKISCLGQHSGNYFSNAVSPGVTTNKPVFQE